MVFYQSAVKIGHETDVKSAIRGTLKNIYAEGEWVFIFVIVVLLQQSLPAFGTKTTDSG